MEHSSQHSSLHNYTQLQLYAARAKKAFFNMFLQYNKKQCMHDTQQSTQQSSQYKSVWARLSTELTVVHLLLLCWPFGAFGSCV